MSTRSIAVGSGPDVQALINEWTEDGFVVESTFDGSKWWHRRVSPDSTARIESGVKLTTIEIVESSDENATAQINWWAEYGDMVVSRRLGGVWVNARATVSAGAR